MIVEMFQARQCQLRIDRNTIDQIKTLPAPPPLVCTIMELMISLLQTNRTPSHPSDSHLPHVLSGVSQESSGSKRKSLASLPSGTKVDKERWSQIQLAMGDSQHFLDLINGLNWEEGLSREAVDLVESTLATSHAKVLDSATSTADSTISSTDYGGLITVSMARHASEATASMCAFAIAIVNYQYLFEPYRIARERADKLRKDIAGTTCACGIFLASLALIPSLPGFLPFAIW